MCALAARQSRSYFRDRRGFYVYDDQTNEKCLVAWSAYTNPTSPISAFDGLDRAASLEAARAALLQYPGPTQNFVVAQRDGRVAYQLAGWIPNDPAWARYAHREGYRAYPILPFRLLPHVAASQNAIVWTANNKMYGKSYRYRLSATFEQPYRAFRIEQLLKGPAQIRRSVFLADASRRLFDRGSRVGESVGRHREAQPISESAASVRGDCPLGRTVRAGFERSHDRT